MMHAIIISAISIISPSPVKFGEGVREGKFGLEGRGREEGWNSFFFLIFYFSSVALSSFILLHSFYLYASSALSSDHSNKRSCNDRMTYLSLVNILRRHQTCFFFPTLCVHAHISLQMSRVLKYSIMAKQAGLGFTLMTRASNGHRIVKSSNLRTWLRGTYGKFTSIGDKKIWLTYQINGSLV